MSCRIPIVIVLATCLAAPPAAALYGGAEAPAAEGLSVVALKWKAKRSSGSCTGALIAPKAVLTAAHCVVSPKGQARRVRSVRIGNPKGATLSVDVAAVVVHPEFEPAAPERGADLAVLLLSKPAVGRASLRLARDEDMPSSQGTRLDVRGFGLTRVGKRMKSSRWLRAASIEYLSPFACFSGPVTEMAKTRMCGASPDAGVCPGDSGAPATRRIGGQDVLVGVVSIALDLTRCAETATVMTRVSHYRDWILGAAAQSPEKASQLP